MKKAYAVIGANLGDEGKGHMVDYLVAESKNSLVVRFNGGAQAGHTVITENRKHIFSHFGSGSLSGAVTYLSSFFVLNPILFLKEYTKLEDLTPTVYTHPLCYVTTPYDIMLNQAIEKGRGNLKHGSCGVGVNETIDRSLLQDNPLVAYDLISRWMVNRKLDGIIEYALERLKTINTPDKDEVRKLIENKDIKERFIEDCLFMGFHTQVKKIAEWDGDIVFEGAQGLGLDMDTGHFPYVTRSNTGIKNVSILAEKMGINHLKIIYVTRAYLTRHGAGPMDSEQTEFTPIDETNVYNQHQGSLRYGWLDIDKMNQRIFNDLKGIYPDIQSIKGIVYTPEIALTCIDQIDFDNFFVIRGGVITKIKKLKQLISMFDIFKLGYLSYGPNRDDIYRAEVV
jgi:adenylosuccinate synthase